MTWQMFMMVNVGAMVLGVLFHSYISVVEWVVPYLIFTMLAITFCRVRLREFDLSPMLWIMLAVQIIGSVAVFLAVRPLDIDLAQAAFICVLCPTATAAPVVTGMLGGSIPRVAAFSVLSNLSVALLAPVLFTWVGDSGADLSFKEEFISISMKVAPMIVFPMLLAFILYFCAPKFMEASPVCRACRFICGLCRLLLWSGVPFRLL